MTYNELKKYYKDYSNSEKEYRVESKRHFPTTWSNQQIQFVATPITKDEIIKIKKLREMRDKKENEWHQAVIEFCNTRK